LPAVSGKNTQTITGAINEMAHSTLIDTQMESNMTKSTETELNPTIAATVETIDRNPVAVDRYLVGKSSVP